MKKLLLTAIIAIASSAATDAQILRTMVAQGEIEGVESNGFAL